MARSLNAIQMDYGRAMRQAQQLDEVAAHMKRLADQKLEGIMENLGSGWTGDNSAKYIGKGRQLEERIIGTSHSLAQIAQSIRTIAQNVYEAERRAWEIAHYRDH